MNFTPESYLLNNIYIPFISLPKKLELNCKDNCTIETGINNLPSTINIENNNEDIIPFIDLNKFDYETKDWFWLDEEGLPLRIRVDEVEGGWVLDPIYPCSNNYGKVYKFDPNNIMYDKDGKNLGWYSLVTKIDYEYTQETIKVFNGKPIFLSINSRPVKDLTDYVGLNSDIKLAEINTDSNKEFYYNFQLNKIYTNQNLNNFIASDIKIYFFNMIDSVKVKGVISGNSGMNNNSTPIIDYYIAKLHGQYLKG